MFSLSLTPPTLPQRGGKKKKPQPQSADPLSWSAMPLYWAGGRVKAHPRQRSFRKRKTVVRSGRTNDDGSVVPLARLCLLSLADNMKDIWVKDYADNYMDQYAFRYIMGPFNYLREFVRIYFLRPLFRGRHPAVSPTDAQ